MFVKTKEQNIFFCGVNLKPLSTCRGCPDETAGNSSLQLTRKNNNAHLHMRRRQSPTYFSQVPMSVAAIFKLITFCHNYQM